MGDKQDRGMIVPGVVSTFFSSVGRAGEGCIMSNASLASVEGDGATSTIFPAALQLS
jgi:hypothetical protein